MTWYHTWATASHLCNDRQSGNMHNELSSVLQSLGETEHSCPGHTNDKVRLDKDWQDFMG